MKTKIILFIIFFFISFFNQIAYTQNQPNTNVPNAPMDANRLRGMIKETVPDATADKVLSEFDKIMDTIAPDTRGSEHTEGIIKPLALIKLPEIRFYVWFLRTSGVLDEDYRSKNNDLATFYPGLYYDKYELAKKLINNSALELLGIGCGTSLAGELFHWVIFKRIQVLEKLNLPKVDKIVKKGSKFSLEAVQIFWDAYLFYWYQIRMILQIADLFEYPINNSTRVLEAFGIISYSISISVGLNIVKNIGESDVRTIMKKKILAEVAKHAEIKGLKKYIKTALSSWLPIVGGLVFASFNYYTTKTVGHFTLHFWSGKLAMFKNKNHKFLSILSSQYPFFDIMIYLANADNKISDEEKILFLIFLKNFDTPEPQIKLFSAKLQLNEYSRKIEDAAIYFRNTSEPVKSYFVDLMFFMIYFDKDVPISELDRANFIFKLLGYNINEKDFNGSYDDEKLGVAEMIAQGAISAYYNYTYKYTITLFDFLIDYKPEEYDSMIKLYDTSIIEIE